MITNVSKPLTCLKYTRLQMRYVSLTINMLQGIQKSIRQFVVLMHMDEVDCLKPQQIWKFHYLPQNLSFQRRVMTKHKTIYENCLTNCHSNNEITQDIRLFLRNQFNTCFCIYSQSIRNASNTFHIQYYPCKYKIINNLKVEEIMDQCKH